MIVYSVFALFVCLLDSINLIHQKKSLLLMAPAEESTLD